MDIQRDGKKWIVTGDDGWISRRKFPTKWKADIALQIWQRQGRVSDYFAAIRAQKDHRADSRRQTAARARHSAIERFGSDAAAGLSKEIPITIRRQPGHQGAAVVSLTALRDFHLRKLSGGIEASLGRPVMHARVWCDAIAQKDRDGFGHSCSHGEGPHEILVCVNKSDNDRIVYGRLLASTRV
jgi:hypothetical protein